MRHRITVVSFILSILSTLGVMGLDLKDGDIIFQKSMSRQSQAIEAATNSKLTHVGIVFHDWGIPYVYEAVQPVKKTRFSVWCKRGRNGNFVVQRLKDRSNVNVKKLKKEVRSYLGRNYDSLFGWCDSTIYCSELVWKAYDRACGIQVGKLRRLKDFNLSHPDVKGTLKCRYGRSIPYNMQVIAPVDIFTSALLYTVHSQ